MLSLNQHKHGGKMAPSFFLCFSSLFIWVISWQAMLSNGLGSVHSNYGGRGLTSNMPSPSRRGSLELCIVDRWQKYDKNIWRNLVFVCARALSWPAQAGTNLPHSLCYIPPPHSQKINTNGRQMASPAGPQERRRSLCVFGEHVKHTIFAPTFFDASTRSPRYCRK